MWYLIKSSAALKGEYLLILVCTQNILNIKKLIIFIVCTSICVHYKFEINLIIYEDITLIHTTFFNCVCYVSESFKFKEFFLLLHLVSQFNAIVLFYNYSLIFSVQICDYIWYYTHGYWSHLCHFYWRMLTHNWFLFWRNDKCLRRTSDACKY